MNDDFDDYIEEEKKRFGKREFKEGMNLKEVLSFLNKDELVYIGESHGLKNIKSKKKSDISSLVRDIIFENLEDIIVYFNENHLDVLKRLDDFKLYSEVDRFKDLRFLEEVDCVFPYLQGEDVKFFIPFDIETRLKFLSKKHKIMLENNTYIVKIIGMCIEYYGIISKDDLVKYLNENMFKDIGIEDLDEILDINVEMVPNVEYDGNLIYHTYFDDVDSEDIYLEMYSEIQINSDNDYKIITEYEMGHYLETNEINVYTKSLKDFIVKYSIIDEESIDGFIYLIKRMVSLEFNKEEIINGIELIDKSKQKDLEDMISKFYSYQPSWFKKGYSRRELNIVDTKGKVLPFVKREDRVGRNDPCPCGSGKKYKKCCLNKFD